MFLGLTTDQPDTTPMDIMSVLSIVLLFVGSGVGGLGVLGWFVSAVAIRRYDRTDRQLPPSPVRFPRLSVLPWAIVLLFLVSGPCVKFTPAALCAIGAGHPVEVSVNGAIIQHSPMAGGDYPTADGNQGVTILDSAPQVGTTVRACVGWSGSGSAWTHRPWYGLWGLVGLAGPVLAIEIALGRAMLRRPKEAESEVSPGHSVV